MKHFEMAENIKSEIVALIDNAAPGQISVDVHGNRVTVYSHAPLRTFEIICETADTFRVKETTGWPTSVKVELSPYSERDIINKKKKKKKKKRDGTVG